MSVRLEKIDWHVHNWRHARQDRRVVEFERKLADEIAETASRNMNKRRNQFHVTQLQHIRTRATHSVWTTAGRFKRHAQTTALLRAMSEVAGRYSTR